MRIKHKLVVNVGDDAALKDKLFSTDEDLAEVVIDNYQRQVSGKMYIQAAAVENVPLGDVDAAKGVFLKVDQDVTIKLNGGATVLQLRKASELADATAKMFLEADITAVEVTAPAGADVNAVYCVWGDPS